jgi:hypothetical protein
MKWFLPALAALALGASAMAQNVDEGAAAAPAPAATPAKPAATVAKAEKPVAMRTPAAPSAHNSIVAGPDDLGEQPINAAPFSPDVQSQDTDADDRSNDGYRGPVVAVPLIIAGIGFLALSGLALYFLPTIIAVARRKRNGWAIFALNFLLGWSFIGWVAALVWAVMSDTP